MLQGYVDAYRSLENNQYLEAALTNAEFIEAHCLQKDFRLNRIYKMANHPSMASLTIMP